MSNGYQHVPQRLRQLEPGPGHFIGGRSRIKKKETRMKTLLLAFTFAASLFGTSVMGFEMEAMSDTERQIFREEIRAYLLDNPEVLLEAIGVLEQRQATAQIDGDANLIQVNGVDLFNDENSYVGGNPDGDITMVEFLDYRCSFCRKAHPEVAELIKTDGNIRYIVKEYPILGPQSELASRFAIATLQLEGSATYKIVNDRLMTLRAEISNDSLNKLAKDLDMDGAAIMARMDSDIITQIIAQNRALAQRLQISGTPSFVVGDTMLRGYLPLENMRQVMKDVRTQ